MNLNTFKTSKPVFKSYIWDDGESSSKTMSVAGIFFKSIIGILVIAAITAYLWKLNETGIAMKWFTLGGMLGAIILSVLLSVRQNWAHILVPLYVIA